MLVESAGLSLISLAHTKHAACGVVCVSVRAPALIYVLSISTYSNHSDTCISYMLSFGPSVVPCQSALVLSVPIGMKLAATLTVYTIDSAIPGCILSITTHGNSRSKPCTPQPKDIAACVDAGAGQSQSPDRRATYCDRTPSFHHNAHPPPRATPTLLRPSVGCRVSTVRGPL